MIWVIWFEYALRTKCLFFVWAQWCLHSIHLLLMTQYMPDFVYLLTVKLNASRGYLRFWPTLCSTLCLASMSRSHTHTQTRLLMSPIHTSRITPPPRSALILELNQRLALFFFSFFFPAVPFTQSVVSTGGSFLMTSITCCFQTGLFLSVQCLLKKKKEKKVF